MEALVTPVVEKIVESLVVPIGKQFGYLFFYNSNIQKMIRQVKKLEDKKCEVEQRVVEAEYNGEITRDNVKEWLESVDENKLYEAKVLEDEGGKGCWKKPSLNPVSRYRLSRKAVKKTQELVTLLADGKFDTVSYRPPPPGIVPVSTDDQIGHGKSEEASTSTNRNEGFQSRLSILNGVMGAIQDDASRIIGICGMGGIGKTTLLKEVAKRARNERLFDEIAMAVVTKEVDEKRIQDDIAGDLGLTLNEPKLSVRASRLHGRLTQKQKGPEDKFKRILILLDDMWGTVDLDEVGIPSGCDLNDCKIVLASRSRNVCNQMNASKIFLVDVLEEEEAWSLFQKVAKTSLQPTDKLYKIGRDIVNECNGLPIAITTNAIGLKNKSSEEWIYVLKELLGSEIEGEYAAAIKTLKVRFDLLKSKEIKHLFLLCCLFPEDYNIPIEDLVRYGFGLGLFNSIKKLEEARGGALKYVEVLRNSNLLLASESSSFVKMHDVVRDFAIWIADKGDHVFMVRFGNELHEWPVEKTYENYTSISLQCDAMHEFPNNLSCPNLNMLQLVHRKEFRPLKFPKGFFSGMEKLQVLALRSMPVPTLRFWTDLRTLSLNNCKFANAYVLGYLEKLEILSCVGSSIKELPEEAQQLKQLRLLDLTGCKEFHRIAPGVLTSLVCLEELYMRGTSMCWAEQIHGGQEVAETNASFAELKSLSNLAVVEIEIPYEVFPIGGAEPGLFSKERDEHNMDDITFS